MTLNCNVSFNAKLLKSRIYVKIVYFFIPKY